MSHAIAGVAPIEGVETTVMTVWPSVSSIRLLGFPVGKLLGQLYNLKAGFYIFTLGNLFALLSIPLAIVLYFKRIGPFVATRYRVTNRRVIVERGLSSQPEKWVELNKFDSIDVVVTPGDEWFKTGDLVFRQGGVERFRLEGLQRPETFRQVCMKSRQAYVGVLSSVR